MEKARLSPASVGLLLTEEQWMCFCPHSLLWTQTHNLETGGEGWDTDFSLYLLIIIF